MLGKHFVGNEALVFLQLAQRDDALSLAEQIGQDASSIVYCTVMVSALSVMSNSTVRPSSWRRTLPVVTRPPTRMARPTGASPDLTAVGV